MTETYCLDLLRAQAPDLYLAVLYAPADRRPLFGALAAWAVELEHVCDAAQDSLLRAARYAWWRERLEAGESRGHPLLTELTALGVAPSRLLPLLEAWDGWAAGEQDQTAIGAAMAALLGRTLWPDAAPAWMDALARLYTLRLRMPTIGAMEDLGAIRSGLAKTPKMARCLRASGPYVALGTRAPAGDALSLRLQFGVFRAVMTGRW